MLHLWFALTLVAAQGKPHSTRVAVLDVEDVSSTEGTRAKLLTQILVGELHHQRSRLDVISSSEIKSMIGFDRQKQLLGCKEDSCLAELGGALGVEYLITAQLGKLGKRYRFDLRLIDAAHSRVVGSEGGFIAGDDDALGEAVVPMLQRLLVDGGLNEKSDLSPPQATPEPVGGIAQATPAPSTSNTAAYVTGGAAVVLAIGAAVMSVKTKSTFDDAVTAYANHQTPDDASLKWSAPLADALWVGAAALAGTSAYLFLRAPESGSGGELGVRGSF